MRPHIIPKEILNLTEDQRDQLHAWLDDPDLTFPKVRDLFLATFGTPITEGKLKRYNQKRQLAEDLSVGTDLVLDPQALLDLYNGRSLPFSPAGILLIQKRAFELAAAPKTSVGKLSGLLRILSYQQQVEFTERRVQAVEKSAATRERAVAVRERLADLRELETRARLTKRPAQGPPPSKPAAPASPSSQSENQISSISNAPASPAEKVLRCFDGVPAFIRATHPGERLSDALHRLYEQFEAAGWPPERTYTCDRLPPGSPDPAPEDEIEQACHTPVTPHSDVELTEP